MYINETKNLINFLEKSTDCYHAAENIAKYLTENGFERLFESDAWRIERGGKYFVMRNMSSVIAFKLPYNAPSGVMIAASHSDSPSFKVKPNPDMETEKHYVRINTEGYGGMIDYSWLDRPLSVSGKVTVRTDEGIESRLVNIDRDLLLIPSLCIHMNSSVNKGYEFNHQRDLIPLFGQESGGFMKLIAENAGADVQDIKGYDLFLYNRVKGSIWGGENEYFSCGRIDDLQCAYASMRGFVQADVTDALQMAAVFDNEETGSGTKQGAKSDFLYNTLERIFACMGYSREDCMRTLANGFMVSADNGHAVHPNHAEKSDPTNRIYMNEGVVIKYNANQNYTTDSVSEAVFKTVCERAGVPYQEFTNRSDMRGGSTLGNLSNTQVSLNTVDIGLAQLAMHSSYETAGTKDTSYMIKAVKEFFNTVITAEKDTIIKIAGAVSK